MTENGYDWFIITETNNSSEIEKGKTYAGSKTT